MVQEDWEVGLLESWWHGAAQLSSECHTLPEKDDWAEIRELISGISGRSRTPSFVQSALRQLSKSRFFRQIGPAILISELRQVPLSLRDEAFKRAILTRFATKIAPDTRVVIAHSLGSIIAYEALCAENSVGVDTLITLGSPLGIRNVIFELLTPRPADGRGAKPNVRRWVNISDVGDLVALQKELAPLFDGVEDIRLYNGSRSHDVLRYLSAAETGEAVARGLGSTPS